MTTPKSGLPSTLTTTCLICALTSPGLALAAEPTAPCAMPDRSGSQTYELAVVTVTSTLRPSMITPACAGAEPVCVGPTVLSASSQVLAGATTGGWRCVTFRAGSASLVSAWTPATNLRVTATPTPSWAGVWISQEADLSLTLHGAAVHASGTATHAFLSSIHMGEIDADAQPVGRDLRLSEGPCLVSLTVLGDWLLASDNYACGGVNVTFGGLYWRQRTSAP